MTKFRYPFVPSEPVWIECPIDPFTKGCDTFFVLVGEIPGDKVKELKSIFASASSNYFEIENEYAKALAETNPEYRPTDKSDLVEGAKKFLSEVASLSRPLRVFFTHLITQYETKGKIPQTPQADFLSHLREISFQASEYAGAVVRFAESLFRADHANARQLVTEAFAPKRAEARAALDRARKRIASLGIRGHRDFVLVTPQGQEIEAPFSGGKWSYQGVQYETATWEQIEFYERVFEGPVLVSLSEIVLAYQEGRNLTPQYIWERYESLLKASKGEKEPANF